MFFDKYFINDNRSAVEAAHITARATRELGKTLESISQSEIKSKDRVDISLEDYTWMQNRIVKLERENRELFSLFHDIGIPLEVVDAIDRKSINVVHCDHIRDFKRKYHIEFVVDASPDLMKWRYEY